MTEVLSKPETRDAGWVACPGCRALVWGRRWKRELRVCGHCGRHDRVGARARIEQLFDPGTAADLALRVGTGDPLGFHDSRAYSERLRAAQRRTGLEEAVVCVTGRIQGQPVVAAVMDFGFLGGSLGGAVGELITRAAEEALATRTPLLLVTASGGARMQEGAVSLMQMAKTSAALGQLDEAGVLTIALITDPTFGGVAASFATLADVIVAEPGARLGFAGPRVIAQTIRQELPEGFQTAEFLLEHGLVDTVQPRAALRQTLGRLLAVGTRSQAGPAGTAFDADTTGSETADAKAGAISTVNTDNAARDIDGPNADNAADSIDSAGTDNTDIAGTANRPALALATPFDIVRRARALDRPTTLDYFARILDDLVELHGDRQSEDCPAIVGGLGRLDGVPVMAIGTQKGHTVSELTARQFGMASPGGYRKAARLMRLAAKLGLPVITLIDTPGAHPGLEAEQGGQAAAIAENLRLMAALPVPVVAAVTGEGGSGGALALGVADRVLILQNAVYSVISPEGCAAILWNDPAAAPQAAAALRLTSADLLRLGVVDIVVPEPPGGPGADPAHAADLLAAALRSALTELAPLDGLALVSGRRARFRRFTADMTPPGEAQDADRAWAEGGVR